MEIRNYQEGDEKHILPLFERVFGRPMSLENWRWRFIDNPAGQKLIKLMWDEDKLVGHYAVSPIIVSIAEQSHPSVHSLATMTHPEYGGRGIFKKLAAELYSFLENEYRSKAVWGFPNTNSHYGFIKYLQWQDIGVIHTLAINPVHLDKVISSYSPSIITGFEDRDERFINNNLDLSKVHVKKNLAYLNWRYIKKPGNNYKIVRVFDREKYIGLAVVKLYGLTNSGKNPELNILELYVDVNYSLTEVIKTLIGVYPQNLSRVSLWQNVHSLHYALFEKVGFQPDLPLTYLSARPNKGIPHEFMAFKNWELCMGDSDVF